MAKSRKKTTRGQKQAAQPVSLDSPELQRARERWSRNQFEPALKLFRQAVRRQPDNTLALTDAARAFGVRFLRAVDFLQLGTETAIDMTAFDIDYTSISIPVVPEALGENVIIEWTFVSDGSVDAFSGLSIDDIEVVE